MNLLTFFLLFDDFYSTFLATLLSPETHWNTRLETVDFSLVKIPGKEFFRLLQEKPDSVKFTFSEYKSPQGALNIVCELDLGVIGIVSTNIILKPAKGIVFTLNSFSFFFLL